MKTQIDKIKIGSPYTVGRILDGEITPNKERLNIMQAVKKENGECLNIIIGNTWKVHLTYSESTSGKTFWYCGDIPEECFKRYMRGTLPKHENEYSIQIGMNAGICLYVANKRSANAQWKVRQMIRNISPAEIRIL